MIERDEYQVPADAIMALARHLLPAIRSYFESEEGMAAFAEWKSQQDAETLSVGTGKKSGGQRLVSQSETAEPAQKKQAS